MNVMNENPLSQPTLSLSTTPSARKADSPPENTPKVSEIGAL
jgi:hypothetical protein